MIKLWLLVKRDKLVLILFILTVFSMLRNLLIPLMADELTYANIAKNIILNGQFALHGNPSSVTPSIPFQIAFFYIKENPSVGFFLAKVFNFVFLVLGLKYLFLFLFRLKISQPIALSILLLTVVNTNFVSSSLRLYPETILFFAFWMFIYYSIKEIKGSKDVLLIISSFVLLVITRYVFVVLAPLVAVAFYLFLKNHKRINKNDLGKLTLLAALPLLPLFLWLKYILNIDIEAESTVSYFDRFREQGVFYNLKAGIGLIQHHDVNKINGIPAFITLFLPITGFRNWPLSIIVLLLINTGYFLRLKKLQVKIVFFGILAVMLGLAVAGTGFSRYWLPLLPGFILGGYFFVNSLKIEDEKFVVLAKIVAVLYVLNGIRLDINFFHTL